MNKFINLVLFIFIIKLASAQVNIKVIGHRGGSSYNYPENTLISIEQAFIEGVFACEIDIRTTSDGIFILMHDSLVDRTTDGKGSVSQLTYSYIKTLDAGSWKGKQFKGAKVPTFIEAIQLAQKYHKKLYLDMKVSDVESIAEVLRASGAPADIIIPSPDSFKSIEVFHSFLPNTPLVYFGALPESLSDSAYYKFFKDNGVIAVEIAAYDFFSRGKTWTDSFIRNLHSKGIELWVYTINEASLFNKLKKAGVDGLETDRPGAATDYFYNDGTGGYFPEKRITGQWDFKNEDFSATIGSDMNERGDINTPGQQAIFASTREFSIPDINGTDAEVMKVPPYDSQHYLEFYSNIAPEGDTIGFSCDYSYSVVIDLLKPASSVKSYISILQTSHANKDDADIFINNQSKGIGIAGQYDGLINDNTWYRIALIFNLPEQKIDKYINGIYVGTTLLWDESMIDRFCLNNNWGVQASCFFSDNDNETDVLYVNSIQIRNYTMSSSEIELLGAASAGKIPDTIIVDSVFCPDIVKNPADTVICEGGTATFSVSASTTSNYAWQVNAGNGWTDLKGTLYSGNASPSLKIANVPLSLNGYSYRCIVSNLCAVTSLVATLNTTPFIPVSITTSGVPNICKGNSFVMRAKALGVFNYQWIKNEYKIEGATNSVYSALDFGEYYVIASDNNGCSKASGSVRVTIYEPPKTVISSASTTICSGDSAKLAADNNNIDNFETSDFTSYKWLHGGSIPWSISDTVFYEGNYSAVSGHIDDYQMSSLSLDMDIISEDSISFYVKVFSEPDYDFLYFFINDIAVKRWSGETGWLKESFSVRAGVNNFRWVYMKDKNISMGSDCAWLDKVMFPGANSNLSMLYQWKKNNNVIPGATSSLYYAKSNDNFTLNCTNSNNCSADSKPINITVNSLPEVNIGRDTTITLYEKLVLDAGSGYKSYKWNDDSTSQTITVDGSKLGTGIFNFTVFVTNNNNCSGYGKIQVNVIPGLYSIYGQLYYDNMFKTPMNNTIIFLKNSEGIIIDSLTTDISGYYRFINIRNGKYLLNPVIFKKWGGVNPIDALFVNRYYIRLVNFKNILMKKAADVNNDKSINPSDALTINRRYIKILNSFKSGDWLFDNDTLIINRADLLYNIKASCFGDVNGSYIPKK